MRKSVFTHKDCVNFKNGYCTLLNIPVNSEGTNICPNFTPKMEIIQPEKEFSRTDLEFQKRMLELRKEIVQLQIEHLQKKIEELRVNK